MYYENQSEKCEYVVRLHDGKYDVGFDKQEDGSYSPVFDEWGNHVGNKLGASCPIPSSKEGKAQHCIGKLMQEYGKEAAINSAMSEGYMVIDSYYDENGDVQLLLEV